MIESVTVVGIGKVGGSVAARCTEAGATVTRVTRVTIDAWLADSSSAGTVVVLATKDDVLERVVQRLMLRSETLRQSVVLHVNGSLGREVLAPLQNLGIRTAAAHPFQTFGSIDPTALDGIGWGVECDSAAWSVVRDFVKLTGGEPWLLTDVSRERRLRYHAAAVAASNFTYAAYELARKLAADADIPAPMFLPPIMLRTYENAVKALVDDLPFAVTGPLVRGDVTALERQLAAIPFEERAMYCNLSRALLAVVAGRLQPNVVAQIEQLLR